MTESANIAYGYELRDQSSTTLFLPHGETHAGPSRWIILGDWLQGNCKLMNWPWGWDTVFGSLDIFCSSFNLYGWARGSRDRNEEGEEGKWVTKGKPFQPSVITGRSNILHHVCFYMQPNTEPVKVSCRSQESWNCARKGNISKAERKHRVSACLSGLDRRRLG